MTTYDILKILKEKDKPYSGNDIGNQIGISRMAVNKHVKKLQSLGYNIDCIQNLGYLLKDEDTLNSYELKYQLEKRGIILDDIIYKPTVSTNIDAVNFPIQDLKNVLIAAPYQSQGKGRKKRVFISEEGGGYFSLIIKPENFLIAKSMFMTIITAISVVKALENYDIKAKIKWPNDIIFNNLKLCGILCEAKSSGEYVDSFIIGVGVNINNNIDSSLNNIATSLKLIKGKELKRASIIADIVFNIIKYSKIYEKDAKEILKIYKSYSLTLGQNVIVILNDNSYNAKAVDLTDDGFLIVEKDGINNIVLSGDVTIRY
jgi:BirA family biotin operon repressor/biotin-[acetyl-CoA-carboxylase] ligase